MIILIRFSEFHYKKKHPSWDALIKNASQLYCYLK